jgi:hypothetical protein
MTKGYTQSFMYLVLSLLLLVYDFVVTGNKYLNQKVNELRITIIYNLLSYNNK